MGDTQQHGLDTLYEALASAQGEVAEQECRVQECVGAVRTIQKEITEKCAESLQLLLESRGMGLHIDDLGVWLRRDGWSADTRVFVGAAEGKVF